MTQGKHWSEFLIPVPMTVSLMSMLMLVSSMFNNAIRLQAPSEGFRYLKWDSLQPELEHVKNNMILSFETSFESMTRIKFNSEKMNEQLERSVKYASLDQDTKPKLRTKKKLLTNSIKTIQSLADENIKKADQTIKKFNTTSLIIGKIFKTTKVQKGRFMIIPLKGYFALISENQHRIYLAVYF